MTRAQRFDIRKSRHPPSFRRIAAPKQFNQISKQKARTSIQSRDIKKFQVGPWVITISPLSGEDKRDEQMITLIVYKIQL